jgi:DNA mismatch repair protein MutS
VLARDGGVIAEGYDAELDELRTLSTNADQFLIDLEARERAASGIATLKVGYNRVHGYYIEISKRPCRQGAPTHYTRRQTITGRRALHHRRTEAVRGQGAVGEGTRADAREGCCTNRSSTNLNTRLEPCAKRAAAFSELDVLATLRRTRARTRLVACRHWSKTAACAIERGRHPVVEAVRDDPFEPNDLQLDAARRACW